MNSVSSFKDIGQIYAPTESGYKQVKRGEIYYVEKAGYTGSEQSGGRTAVIVGNEIGNEKSPVVLMVYLTTRYKPCMPTHVNVDCREPSTALCEQIFTIDKSRLGDYIKTASDTEMQEIDKALAVSLNLTPGRMQIPEAGPQDDELLCKAVERVSDIASLVEHVRCVSGTLSRVQGSRWIGLWGDESVRLDDVLSSGSMELVVNTAVGQIEKEKGILLDELKRLIGTEQKAHEKPAQSAVPPEMSGEGPIKKHRGGRKKIYDAERLKELAEKGLSRQQIADEMEVSYSTVTRWITEQETERKPKAVKMCGTCIYRSRGRSAGNCDYIILTGHSRGCSAEGCTVYQKGPRLKHDVKPGLEKT